MGDNIRLPDVTLGRITLEEMQKIRTQVRKALYGAEEPVGADVDVILPKGEVVTLSFGPNVGWPTIDGQVVDFMGQWIKSGGKELWPVR